MDKLKTREEIAFYMRLLCDKELTTSSGGNISIRGDEGLIFITPSGPGKNRLGPSDIIEISRKETRQGSQPQPSIETGLHFGIYERRPDISVIIHAHPLFATAFMSTGREIDFDLTDETRIILGCVGTIPFAQSGSEELALSVSGAAERSNVILMKNHGIIALGRSLPEAYSRIELVEMAARITFIGEVSGSGNGLSSGQLDLMDMLGKNQEDI
ncbi:MAG: class II aldolase/adducin family protein [Candidatus Krumholzibacteriota bacterium]|nr:class II aldolase/adducin family protein [Candidatus Krumholzibacteriota bacterium]